MLVASAMLAETCYHVQMPVVDGLSRNPVEAIRTGDFPSIDSTAGVIGIRRGEPQR